MKRPERVKVLLSVSVEDLREIDRRAEAASMSRSSYLVAMGRDGGVRVAGVLTAIRDLRHALERFERDHEKL